MRWMKHLSLASEDEKIAVLIEQHGPEGYGMYWLLLETIAASMLPKSEACDLTYSELRWSQKLRSSVRKTRNVLQSMADLHLISLQSTDNRVRIDIPKLLKYRDEYSEKSRQPSDKVRSRERVDRDREREQRESRVEAPPQAPAQTEKPALAPPPPIAIKSLPLDAEKRIRKLADTAPDQQDHETGVRLAVQELISSANPEVTLVAFEKNIPLWWAAMQEGRARIKPLRFVISDKDYLRRPREPTVNAKSLISARSQALHEELMKD